MTQQKLNNQTDVDQGPPPLNFEECLEVLRSMPHPKFEHSPEVITAFEEFFREIDEEYESSDKAITHGSEEHDDYIYGA